jgi:hypothetical protein
VTLYVANTRSCARLVSYGDPPTHGCIKPMPKQRQIVRGIPAPHDDRFPLPQEITIEKLSDKVLLNIFRYFLEASPRHWPTLMHICRKWRRIVFDSQRSLPIRLFFTHGTPVLKTLECWPTMPIVVQYGGSPALDRPAPEDEDDIVAALKQSDCVTSISLTVTRSLVEKLSAIDGPFSELEDLVLLSGNMMWLAFPNAFQWGPRLRRLHLTGMMITFSPQLIQLLHSSKNLVDLRLHKFLCLPRFLLDGLPNALSDMVQLRSLSLHFLSTAKYPTSPPPSGELVVLPALTCLNFQGRTEHLEDLVTRIDTPLLGQIKVTFLNKSNFDLSKLRTFISQTGMHKSHRRANILAYDLSTSISLTRPGDNAYLKLRLRRFILLSDQLFFMAQICAQFSAFLFNVEDLLISVTRHSRRGDIFDGREWLEGLNSFPGVKWFHVFGNFSTDIVRALDTRRKLPALHKLYMPQPASRHERLTEAVVSLMSSRQLSGHPIAVEYEQRGTGIVHKQCQDHDSLTDFGQDYFHSMLRCCTMTSFSIYFIIVWMPLRNFGLRSGSCVKDGDRSY